MLFTEKLTSCSPPELQQRDGGIFPLILKAFNYKAEKIFQEDKKAIFLHLNPVFFTKGK